MKHLKLFESFNYDGKIDLVNNILIEYLLFSYFIENDIFVQRNYSFSRIVYDFWYKGSWYSAKGLRIETFTSDKGSPAFLSYVVDKSFVEPTSYTEYYLTKAFLGHIDQLNIKKIAKKVHLYNGIKKAMNKYIEFLRNTRDKNHLLDV